MRKIVLTQLHKATAGVVFDNVPFFEQSDYDSKNDLPKERAWGVELFEEENPSLIGNIYIGHVRDVVKNIESAFVEIGPDEMGYLSLKNQAPVFLTRKNTDKICEGDNIIVQVQKDKIKTKDAVLTTQFSLHSRLLVLTHGKYSITFSSKIKDEQFCRRMKEWLEIFFRQHDMTDCPYGLIVRTEAYHAEFAEITKELLALDTQYKNLIKLASTRQKYYLLKEAESPIIRFVKQNLDLESECEIITDDSHIYELIQAQEFTKQYEKCRLRLYADSLLPLYKLYSFESVFEDVYAKKVWLKSGAYLVIEYTEALTVIDVNTGKCEKGKNKEQTIFQINREAAFEIARQLRIRNISGIIIVDFIDMKEEMYTKQLLEDTRKIMATDSVKTKVVDITKLHLMEITRQKTTDKIPYNKDLFIKRGQ